LTSNFFSGDWDPVRSFFFKSLPGDSVFFPPIDYPNDILLFIGLLPIPLSPPFNPIPKPPFFSPPIFEMVGLLSADLVADPALAGD